MTFSNPQYLVETEWLAGHLADPDLRILDCTVFFGTDDRGIRRESGRPAWTAGHIPRSGFADLMGDLSDRESQLPLMMPPAPQFAGAMSRYGVGEGTRVILYDANMNMCAARVWWMLRVFGFDGAAVLNGGWRKWTLENHPTSTDASGYPPTRFIARPRPALIADRHEVLAAIGDQGTCLLNALTPEEHLGTTARYRRPGRIPSSVNVSARGIVDPNTHAYLPADRLRDAFAAVGASGRGRVITYCGGGIAASSDAFVLTLLGVGNVAVYDGSLSEWAADPALPMEVGESTSGCPPTSAL